MDNLPKSVREQADRAEQLLQASLNPQLEVDQQSEQPNALDPAKETAAETNEAIPEPEQQPNQAAPSEADPDEDGHDADYWKRRFKTLEGKYKAEIPRLAEQIREITERAQALETERRELKAKVEAMSPYFDDDDIVEIKEKAKKYESDLREKDEVEALKAEKAKLQREKFFSELAAIIPNWADIDRSESFAKWLNTTERLTGLPFGELLHQSLAKNDSQKAAQIFQTYLQTQNAQPNRRNADEGRASHNSIEEELMPGDSRPSSNDSNASAMDRIGRTWTKAEINRFYRDLTNPEAFNSSLRGTTVEQRSAIEKSIFWAQQNGRVI